MGYILFCSVVCAAVTIVYFVITKGVENPHSLKRIFPAIIPCAVLCIGAACVSEVEAEEFNRGICKENGLEWEARDMDSGGATLYRAGDKTIWSNLSKPYRPGV